MADQADLARDLLALADDDRAAAHALLDVGEVSNAIVGFHAQQAVEKAFKAVLASRRLDFPFTHNIGLLNALTVEEAAARIGRGQATVRRWIRTGRLPSQKEGRRHVTMRRRSRRTRAWHLLALEPWTTVRTRPPRSPCRTQKLGERGASVE
jgi:excisionase family DNA binding protein